MARVEPLTEAWAVALADGDDVFTERFGVQVEPEWYGFDDVPPGLPWAARTTSPD